MKLIPTDPPGRSSRKARRFAQDMRELRAQGYTFEAIRMALAAVGVHVSNATVQREVARAAKSHGVVLAADSVLRPGNELKAPAPMPPTAAPESTTVSSPALEDAIETDARSGKEIAEAFASSRITNPLARARLNAKDMP
ncbi:MAG: hypothetical protein KXJ61_14550 [Hydrogenophaga sp.]|jgi:hypothetical protein|uniref:hypothetical protein n=1 Tax=Hydrogenophaga sp. TaxID=1904254 RepID=UPI001DB375C7|nr:hypothetical protein [Hydrogenophaga sp.]MBW0171438.1 hypothetical protein [Hydrogenophaga sp.]MBW0184296.1 hypothetical protein [Hydrogenophaga sp.]